MGKQLQLIDNGGVHGGVVVIMVAVVEVVVVVHRDNAARFRLYILLNYFTLLSKHR